MIRKTYEILLVDADDTLLDFRKCEYTALSRVLRAHGLEDSPELIAGYSAINDNAWKMLERGEITKERLRVFRYERFVERYALAADPAVLAEEYEKTLAGVVFVLPGAEEACRVLAEKHRMFIITNGLAPVQDRRLAGSGLLPYFEGVFISGRVGHEKPSEAFFDAVASAVPGFSREKTLVIGDSLTSDMAGAIRCGMDSCWISRGKAAPGDVPLTYIAERFSDVPALLGTEKGGV